MPHNNMVAILTEDAKKVFIDKFTQTGKEQFYTFLMKYASDRLNKGELQKPTPEIELLNYHDKFLALYRKENNIEFLEIAKTFRRAAQKVYMIMLDVGLAEKSSKFLNIVGE